MPDQTVPMDALARFGAAVLIEHGLPEADAMLVADSLVVADAWGHPSHGMLRLDWYVARLRSGAMSPVTAVEFVVDAGALAVIDGHDGVGQVITDIACAQAVARAQSHGVGVVAVRNSNHFGTAAYWTRRMAEAGCVGILTTNGSPAMAPWGGREKTVGANPWSIATPGGDRGVVVLDIANTGVARGKIYSALQKGEEIPDTWAIDSEGAPTTDPKSAIDGILLPMAGHKGYGISFMMDVLSGVLTGSSYATGVAGPYVPDQRSGCGHLAIAIDIEAVIGRDAFNERMNDLIALTKSVPLAANVDEIFFPGELENRAERRGRESGVWLPAKTVDELTAHGEAVGVAWPYTEEEVARSTP
ncbi:MAG TPA: Ldh family oxidoreductase [Microbacterium sp.]|uniref:Ldh family oxidoreductase n=1 Tax=Microbacterium sp. TaxID=51671 RepID=UPI002B9B39DC|nr:Ldh family oxidoreductase [Microbacterium sp.]HWI30029.1 Ldh family oxidoreductase [Microbacterium sp.]